jgi:SNF2 family DNA or RNA helicase|tara:strand:+ start:13946 stop:15400 length:1455 start_codon:yes stop_codon:yes gene_type:complete
MSHSNIYPFKTKPYDHQREAWEISKDKTEYALFMEMGTGKSKVAIDTFSYLYDKGAIDSVLIIAPKGVYMNWVNSELPAHVPDHIKTVIANWAASPKKKEKLMLEKVTTTIHDLRILVMNVEAFSTARGMKYAKKFVELSNCMVIVDESTTIKNPTAMRTKNIIKVSVRAKYKRILTGEPVTRSPLDIYTQCQFLNPVILGFSSYYSFRNRYAVMIPMSSGARMFKQVVGYQRLEELSNLVKTFSYRCKKEDCLTLPEKVYQYRFVELSPDQKKIYKELCDKAFAEFEGKELSTVNALGTMLRLHQVTCGHFKSDDGSITPIKNNRLSELMNVLSEAPDKVIIWAGYVADIRNICDAIHKEYGPDSYVSYYGAVTNDDRQTAVKRFQEDPTCRFFIGNPQTGGFGLTLTAAQSVVYYSNSYNLEHRIQSEDRAHRIGQKNTVTYVDLICTGTVDSKIVKSLRDKRQIATQVMGEEWKEWLKLST